VSEALRFKSAWKVNLLIIGSLIGIVLAYYYWQLQQGERIFRRHVVQHARMVAGLIRLNVSREVLSREALEEVIATFLGNAARFVDYLNTVAPFNPEELAAFSDEAGLAGIRIRRSGGGSVEGPPGWLRGTVPCTPEGRLTRVGERGLYALAVPGTGRGVCVTVGMVNARINELREQISLSRLLADLPGLAGIRYVRFDPVPPDRVGSPAEPFVEMRGKGAGMVAEGRLPMNGKELVVGLEAQHFAERMHQLRTEFMAFSLLIALLGGAVTWLLQRYQSAYLDQVRRYERQLAREQEDAALGRASAAITHEIRNPLNAISMGLQRLEMEADSLGTEHRDLVAALRRAVSRTDGIVRELKRYAGAISPKRERMRLDEILPHIVGLYQGLCMERNLSVQMALESEGRVLGDRALLEEVMENLVKNAVEASAGGGTIAVSLTESSGQVMVSMENEGFELPESRAQDILEPYFSTKAQGSGLGLSIANRIVRAHGGRVTVSVPTPGRVRISFQLPGAGPERAAEDGQT
jgi:signal transduction histidine kinase